MPKSYNILSIAVFLMSILFLISLSFDLKPFPFKEHYVLTLLNNKQVKCKSISKAFSKDKILLTQCEDEKTYYLKSYQIEDTCTLECPKERRERENCYRECLSFHPQDPDNIFIQIKELPKH